MNMARSIFQEITSEKMAAQVAADEVSERVRKYGHDRDQAKKALAATDQCIKEFEAAIGQMDKQLEALGAKCVRLGQPLESARAEGQRLIEKRNSDELSLKLLRGARSVHARRHESFNNPQAMQDENRQSVMLMARVDFWGLLERYLETGAESHEAEAKKKVFWCRFNEKELDRAEQLYRGIRKERGLFCNFSSRQIGGYEKPAPWPGCG
jgi:hypothetical protein